MNEQASLSDKATANVQRPHYWREVREMIVSSAETEYEEAFLKIQQLIEPVIQGDKDNAFTNSKYSSLENVLSVVRPILNENGFTLRQFSGAIRGHGDGTKKWFSLPVCTKITHASSLQFEMIVMDLPVQDTAHSIASAMTYGKRIGAMSYLGIATADDDGMVGFRSKVDTELAEKAAEGIIEKINACKSEAEQKKWLAANEEGLKLLSEQSVSLVREAYGNKLIDLRKKAATEKTAQ